LYFSGFYLLNVQIWYCQILSDVCDPCEVLRMKQLEFVPESFLSLP